MKVKNKILATVIPLMILFTILMNIAFGMFFEKFILQQEDNQINIATNSLSSYINERLIKGQGNANDWGNWDDTYNFIETKNAEYIQNNLTESTFENLDLNFVILLNSDDEIIYQQFYSLEKKEFSQFPDNFNIPSNLLSFSKLDEDVSSIMKIGDQYYFISSTDITDSLMTEAANGIMILGKEFDDSVIENIEKITGCRFISISDLDNAESISIPTIINKTFSASGDSIDIKLAVPNKYRIQDSIQINFEMQRFLYTSSMKDAYNFGIFNTVICLVITIIVIIALTYFLTKPFENLLQEVTSIDTTKEKYSKLVEKGNKEFLYLRKSINNLLTKIEHNQERLQT